MKPFETLRKLKQEGGFTLLELLVVVAILAAIAGTATIYLQDTDARAAAAAHVAMMDELQKGVLTFHALHQWDTFPNNFDSLGSTTTTGVATGAILLPTEDVGGILGFENTAIAMAPVVTVPSGVSVAEQLHDVGITHLRYIDASDTVLPAGVATCNPAGGALQDEVASRRNDMVAGNIFNSQAGNGCGHSIEIFDGVYDPTGGGTPPAAVNIAYWIDSIERILGPGDYGDARYDAATAGMISSNAVTGAVAPILMAVGFGPSADLFNPNEIGALTSVPVYRHVTATQYNRFIGLFRIAEAVATGPAAWTLRDTEQVVFLGVVDGAGDTKEEELGEWDGTRSTV